MTGLLVVAVLLVWFLLSVPIAVLIGGMFAISSGCTCRKHAWDPNCPCHGLEAR